MEASPVATGLRVLVDGIMLVLVGIPSLVFKVGNISPTQRGFFCDDESIRYPYHDSTIPSVVLFIVGGLLNIIAFITCEIVHYMMATRRDKKEIPSKRVFALQIHPCLYTICGVIWVFGFGWLFNQGITDVGKFSVGRLRPHFIEGCKPNIDLSSCQIGKYITNFTCLQTDQEIVYDLRLSFPSGHSSGAAYSMVFLILYIQQRVTRFPVSYLFKHILQFIFILMGWYTGLSRVHDNKHHWSDVLAGFVIGTLVAIFCARYLVKSFRDPYRNGPYNQYRSVGSDAESIEAQTINESYQRNQEASY